MPGQRRRCRQLVRGDGVGLRVRRQELVILGSSGDGEPDLIRRRSLALLAQLRQVQVVDGSPGVVLRQGAADVFQKNPGDDVVLDRWTPEGVSARRNSSSSRDLSLKWSSATRSLA